jgi:alkylation response protein AidB-like acyl-CoA dehydrogenase
VPDDARPLDPELAAKARTEFSNLLGARLKDAAAVVLGAGSDDLESGRRFLGLLAEGGWAVPAWPVEHGGRGMSGAESDVIATVLEEFEAPDMYPFLVGLGLIGPTILVHGTEEQKARWLPSMRSGENIWCQMFSEPDAGSDLANLKMRAERDGDGWRLSGSKVWTSRAHYASSGMLLARSDPSLPKHAGITAFCIEMHTPGVTVRPLIQMNGDSHFNEVFLDEVWISDADRLGAVNDGWRVGLTTLSLERGSLSGDLGVSMDSIHRLAKASDLAVDPVAKDRLMSSVIDLKITQWSARRTQAERAGGKQPGPEGSLAKLRTNHMIKKISTLALDLAGPASTVSAAPPSEWTTMWMASPSLSIRGGTDEIQHNILGERLLGLPTEPRVDKGKPFSDRPDR